MLIRENFDAAFIAALKKTGALSPTSGTGKNSSTQLGAARTPIQLRFSEKELKVPGAQKFLTDFLAGTRSWTQFNAGFPINVAERGNRFPGVSVILHIDGFAYLKNTGLS